MALLCFLLDLRNIPPPILDLLKQCLLHLANHYAAAPSPPAASASAAPLPDRLALCYVHRAAAAPSGSSSRSPPELKIAYRPGEKFSLRDFHHAVENLPLDGFLPEQHGSVPTGDVSLQNLFSNRAIYSWATDDISKKVIAICFSAQNTEPLRRSLMEASEQCITVEFVMLETETAAFMYDDVSENSSSFIHRISDLENCVVRRYSPETQVLHGLVKRWLEELKDDKEEMMQAVLVFRVPIIKSVNQVTCSIYPSANQIIDGFPYCQICRCHGRPIDDVTTHKAKWLCPTTSRQLAASDVTDSAVKIGDQTVLFLPTSEGGSNMRRASTSISFDVIERTDLASLNEGVIMGKSHVVVPSSNDEVALTDESLDQNTQIFYGLCETLFKLDQGLVCSSACNTETMKIGTLACYYLLQPSEKGPMLLRRLAGSEEILPLPDVSRPRNYTVSKDTKNSIETSLSKIAVKEYNPLHHERGFHSKLNSLVKDSLQFGSITPAYAVNDAIHLDSFSEPQIPALQGPRGNMFMSQREKARDADRIYAFSEPQTTASPFRVPKDRLPSQPKERKLPSQQPKEKVSPSISEEWEKLIIIDDNDDFCTPVSSSRAQFPRPPVSMLPSPVKPLDEKTSRILERLEAPKAKKQRASKAAGAGAAMASGRSGVSSTQGKKPLLPFEPSVSQPLKPTFNRVRRKPVP
ncbi:hypothetical protein CFC21_034020 [Triticum aestivum]|uniref:Replication factor A C-terminal domain-containing protein n=2 Tax=Triticum aestivum TaxID=4565 RepID=A0A9R1F2R8_WHEAT|nr:uncharacterized protein LOC123060179 isoform X2 [Triticum aestivum]KAF7020999.1 hypothetical protein CFC21_034020 [Triticum aestivum]